MSVFKKIVCVILLFISKGYAEEPIQLIKKSAFKVTTQALKFKSGPQKKTDSMNDYVVRSVKDKTLAICVPKCGTHLLLKLLTLFNIPGVRYNYSRDPSQVAPARLKKIRAKNELGPPHHDKGIFWLPEVGPLPKVTVAKMKKDNPKRTSFWCHWPYTREFALFLDKNTYANFLMIRDPRAMVVSFARMVGTSRSGEKADLNRIIADLITGEKKYFVKWASEIQSAYPLLWEVGLYEYYKLYLPWINQKNFLLVKFEDLVGPAGGGTLENQVRTIKEIAAHMGYLITKPKLESVTEKLFGGTGTFKEGQSSGWKKYFTPEIKALFQNDKRLMQLLVDLGYEKDFEWINS